MGQSNEQAAGAGPVWLERPMMWSWFKTRSCVATNAQGAPLPATETNGPSAGGCMLPSGVSHSHPIFTGSRDFD